MMADDVAMKGVAEKETLKVDVVHLGLGRCAGDPLFRPNWEGPRRDE